jgi:hypothetical protein
LAALSVILGFARPAPFQSFRHQGTQKLLAEEVDDRSTSQQAFPKCDKTGEIQIFLVVEIERPVFLTLNQSPKGFGPRRYARPARATHDDDLGHTHQKGFGRRQASLEHARRQ